MLALTAVGVVLSQRSQLTNTLDASLRQRADDIEALVAASAPLPAEFGASEQEGFAQLVTRSGSVVASSPNLEGAPPLALGYPIDGPEVIRTRDDLPVDDDAFRVLSRTVSTSGGPAILHVGTTYDVVGESTDALTTSLGISIPIVALLLTGLVWWLVGRTLRPVEMIRSEVAAIGGGDLDRRVQQPTTGDEIALLAATMNEMLERLEDSVGRQQRFVADASHELRSPLTRMRSELEVDLIDESAPSRQRLESLLDEVVALQHLVEDLLHLARSDAADVAGRREAVDLDDLVIAEAKRLRSSGAVIVDIAGVSAAQVVGDRQQLERAIRNLGDNAARYAATTVSFTLGEAGDSAELTITDDGPGIAADQATAVFERFRRMDDSRSRSSGGFGLGLSITREIILGHGGTIAIDTSHRSGARFVVELPRS